MGQFAKGLKQSDRDLGETLQKQLESIKWYLWHGNVYEALLKIEDCDWELEWTQCEYSNLRKLIKTLHEFRTYIENNQALIPNYGERWRYGETITTAFAESTINQVVSKRMVKKQQMLWSQKGAHLLLQVRIRVLNGELRDEFRKWYPRFDRSGEVLPLAA